MNQGNGRNPSRKKRRNPKVNKKIVTITAIGVATLIALFAMKNKADDVTTSKPDTHKINGLFLNKEKRLDIDKMDGSDFIVIEMPNFTEGMGADHVVFESLKLCEEKNKPIAVYLNTVAQNPIEAVSEAHRLHGFLYKYDVNYPFYIDISNISEKVSREELLNIINSYDTELHNLGYLPSFSMKEDLYQQLRDGLSEDVKIQIQSGNKKVQTTNVESVVYNSGFWGMVFGNGYTYDNFETQIYTYQQEPAKYISRVINEGEQEEKLIGIDVSSWQGQINWEETSKHIDFSVLRFCDFYKYNNEGTIDSEFVNNVNGCIQEAVPFGIYGFSRAICSDDGQREAAVMCDFLEENNVKIDCPIFMDIESYKNGDVAELLENKSDKIVEAAEAFCEEIQSRGYTPGIYMNESDYKLFTDACSKANSNIHREIPFWIARYGDSINYNIKEDDISNVDIVDLTVTPQAGVWCHQFTDNGWVPGIDGPVDTNVAYEWALEDFVLKKTIE